MPDWSLARLASDGRIDPGWARALAPADDDIRALGERLEGEERLPADEHVLRAFQRPFADVRVLIVGQDPYPTPGHAIGLSFAVDHAVRPLPRSLVNIYAERESDIGIPPAPHGDLTAWSDQGVLLLNRVLTVRPGDAGAHRGWGWERITGLAISALAARDQPLVAILWGKDAESAQSMLGAAPSVVSAHPSPLSARRGFFGSKPFSRANAMLIAQGAPPVDWHVGEDEARPAAAATLF